MYLQFLVEDQSGAALIHTIMPNVLSRFPGATVYYDCKHFKGIGGFSKGETPKKIKTQKLLNDLPLYLRGFDKSLHAIDSAIIIVLDNDDREIAAFSNQLHALVNSLSITIDCVFCVAIEEMEAWLLGDLPAIQAAYPQTRLSHLSSYVQDSICGTWELLAGAIHKGGLQQFRKDFPAYPEAGKKKSEWAQKIGAFMRLDENKSPSFQSFLSELDMRIRGASGDGLA